MSYHCMHQDELKKIKQQAKQYGKQEEEVKLHVILYYGTEKRH